MKDLTLRYYDAEMRYLREAAKEFAQTHPDRAAMLDLDKAGTPDPYVERLLEGFAFSMGRLREKIDDDLPELTEGLVSMLWPHYLRTIPSLSVVAFTPALQAVKMAEVMPAGLEVYSRPAGPKNTVCRYRTTRDVMLNPLSISGVTMTTEPDGCSLLRMRFACSTQADWSHADLSHLSLYLGADAPVSSQLHLMLTKRQAALYMRLSGQTDRIRLDGHFSPGGFAEEDGLWPKEDTAGKFPLAALAAGIALVLAGCGLTQKVTDGTVAVTKSIFYKQVKTLHLDIRAREAVNSNAGGVALSTVVRIYQLKDRKTFDSTDYPSLFKADSQAIKADLVAEKDIRLQPGGVVAVDMPMEESAQYVAVAGMFMSPDQENNTWRVVLSRDDLDPDKARVIVADNNRLTLQVLKDE